jgi:hypothetical protein
MKKLMNKIGIKHPRDVYPYCSGEFAAGVRSWLNKNPAPTYPLSKEFIQGYYSAERDMKDNYYLINNKT